MSASELPKDITHWQHFHGFTDDRQSACPAQSADANGDGIIDVVETEPAAGRTMVPFIGDPVGMAVPHGTYPNASATGTLEFLCLRCPECVLTAFPPLSGGCPTRP